MHHTQSANAHFSRISKYKVPTREEEVELSRKVIYENCEYSKEQLILRNNRLVYKIVRDMSPPKHLLDDFIQEGIVGLTVAAERFDATKSEAKFGSFAAHWIKHKIRLFYHYNHTSVRVPVNTKSRALKIKALKMEFDNISDAEIMKRLDINQKTLNFVTKNGSHCEISLDSKIKSDEDDTTHNIIPDNDQMLPCELTVQNETNDLMMEAVTKLNEREQFVIKSRFGMDGMEPKRLVQLSKEMNLSKEMVRLIQQKALKMLRYHMGMLETLPW